MIGPGAIRPRRRRADWPPCWASSSSRTWPAIPDASASWSPRCRRSWRSDAEVAVTISITPSMVTIAEGVDRPPPCASRASSDRLLALVSAPLRFGLPDVVRRRRALGGRRRDPGPHRGSRAAQAPAPGGAAHDAALGAARTSVIGRCRIARTRPRGFMPENDDGGPRSSVFAVIVLVTAGGYVAAALLATPAGPPVGLPGGRFRSADRGMGIGGTRGSPRAIPT